MERRRPACEAKATLASPKPSAERGSARRRPGGRSPAGYRRDGGDLRAIRFYGLRSATPETELIPETGDPGDGRGRFRASTGKVWRVES